MMRLQVVFSGVSSALNVYFLCCIMLVPDVRKPEFILIGWLSFCDIISFSILGNLEKFMNLVTPTAKELKTTIFFCRWRRYGKVNTLLQI